MTKFKALITDIAVSLVPPIVVLLVFLLRIGFLTSLRELDVYVHFFGGLSIAWMGAILWARWLKRSVIPSGVPRLLRDYIILSHVAIIGVCWEFMEWILDHRLGWGMQASLGDTLNDLLMDLLGGIVLIVIYRIIRHMQQAKKKP
jgi:uncharacterized membrane protein YjdF